ncbi:MAG: NnrS family protein, partial [Burkholderiales bacterium]|nr:NnrS family protein [Burkholderiales bacterium]
MNSPAPPFLTYAFRPFFLLNAIFAIAIVILWVMVLQGHGPATLPANTLLWHGHE